MHDYWDSLTEYFLEYWAEFNTWLNSLTDAQIAFYSLIISGFGAWLYEQQGFDKAYIQLLTGHASEKMLDHYLSGHEVDKPIRVDMKN